MDLFGGYLYSPLHLEQLEPVHNYVGSKRICMLCIWDMHALLLLLLVLLLALKGYA